MRHAHPLCGPFCALRILQARLPSMQELCRLVIGIFPPLLGRPSRPWAKQQASKQASKRQLPPHTEYGKSKACCCPAHSCSWITSPTGFPRVSGSKDRKSIRARISKGKTFA
ncbi:hypothetical protein BDZ91DRAFT_782835 [Kalaharituber pfeilii]|nr:hypothetical protein BDZ91DRAFT_782835 [Kalaharituber pfeilii]